MFLSSLSSWFHAVVCRSLCTALIISIQVTCIHVLSLADGNHKRRGSHSTSTSMPFATATSLSIRLEWMPSATGSTRQCPTDRFRWLRIGQLPSAAAVGPSLSAATVHLGFSVSSRNTGRPLFSSTTGASFQNCCGLKVKCQTTRSLLEGRRL